MSVSYSGMSADALAEVVGQMLGLSNAAMREVLAAVVEVDQQRAWEADGARTCEDWLVMRFGLAHARAHELLRVARGSMFCPTVMDAFAEGHLSWDQAVACVDLVAHGGQDEAFVAVDAVGRSASELDRLAREARRVSREQALERQRRQYVKMRWDGDGMLRLHGRFADADGKVIETAVRRLADRVVAFNPEGVPVGRTFDELHAEALVALASQSLAEDPDPDRATVVIHVDAHVLAGDNDALDLAALELGPLVSMATAHRLACDGRCQVVVDDIVGRTVEVAKTVHAVPRWLRRRVLQRDGGCRWPGCERRGFLHAHHIRWWTRDGGPTEETNLCALCPFHHRLVHEGGWEIEGDPIGRLTFTSPRRRVVTGGPPGLRRDVRDAFGLPYSKTADPPAEAA